MLVHTSAALAAAVLLAGHAVAKTDIAGCVSSQTVAYGGASLIWYVPGTGEICEFLDCGGGRAPPKTTVPGCPAYEGTATYSPSYLPGFGAAATAGSSSSSAEVTLTGFSSWASASTSSSEQASITPPPVTKQTSAVSSSTSEEIQTDSSSEAASLSSSPASSSSSSSSVAGGNVTSSSTSSVSTGGAALPTAAIKGAIGAMAGLAAGVAML
ncbi:hypothetical protein F5B17DRAFT_161173 [Nemania serpens]|nr:hypothetical protein F5B17DRAFT_161173 [Nemania serpens]